MLGLGNVSNIQSFSHQVNYYFTFILALSSTIKQDFFSLFERSGDFHFTRKKALIFFQVDFILLRTSLSTVTNQIQFYSWKVFLSQCKILETSSP